MWSDNININEIGVYQFRVKDLENSKQFIFKICVIFFLNKLNFMIK